MNTPNQLNSNKKYKVLFVCLGNKYICLFFYYSIYIQ